MTECSQQDCDRPLHAKGFCGAHYMRWKRHGSAEGGGPPGPDRSLSPSERFWNKVDRSGGPDACWPWLASRSKNGYGQFVWRGVASSPIIASRAAFFFTHGYWPTEARHSCDNPPCCNPAHLSDGNHLDNMLEAVDRARMAHGERHTYARLTPDDVRNIRARAAQGETFASIELDYGLSIGHVSRIVARKRWRHLT